LCALKSVRRIRRTPLFTARLFKARLFKARLGDNVPKEYFLVICRTAAHWPMGLA